MADTLDSQAAAFAQLQVGAIRGTVIDIQRQPLAAATVRLVDSQNSTIRTTTTDAAGDSSTGGESGGTGSSQSRRSVAVRIVPGPNDVLVLIRAGAAMAA